MSGMGMPMRWPRKWNQPAHLELLRGTRIGFLLVEDTALLPAVQDAARLLELSVIASASPPAGVDMISGDCPGVRMTAAQNEGTVTGPTGEPWLVSNGWKVMLAKASHPAKEVWVDTPAPRHPSFAESYEIAVADAAADGGKWVIHLDDSLADAIADRRVSEMAIWRRLRAASDFVADWPWNGFEPISTIGVLSDFVGANEYLSTELLNLLTRDSQQIRILPMKLLDTADLAGLRAIVYPDQSAPLPAVRRKISDYLTQGGMIVASRAWSPAPEPMAGDETPAGYGVTNSGKGRIVVSRKPIEDPYLFAKDIVVLVSHRFDVVRIWNGGAVRACVSRAPGGTRGLLQLVSYANDPPVDTSVRISGSWRKARLFTADDKTGRGLPLLTERDAVEVHLDVAVHHAAIELTV